MRGVWIDCCRGKLIMNNSKDTVRKATVDHIFYPGKQEALLQAVSEYLSHADNPEGDAHIILSPHAGYHYSGDIMGTAYKAAAKGKFSRVVIMSRVHREPEKALFLPESTEFQTPLGKASVDSEALDFLLSSHPLFKKDEIPHTEEHAIEVQLPFIQYLWPHAKIVPILSGIPSLALMRICAESLRGLFEKKLKETLFVVSSNLSAYDHPEDAKKDTEYFLSLLDQGKWEQFPDLLRERKINACSADCLTALYILFKGNLHHTLLAKECDFKGNDELSKKPYEKRVCFGSLAFR